MWNSIIYQCHATSFKISLVDREENVKSHNTQCFDVTSRKCKQYFPPIESWSTFNSALDKINQVDIHFTVFQTS